jgi:hypothetical protein
MASRYASGIDEGRYSEPRGGRYTRQVDYARQAEEIDRPPAYSYDQNSSPVVDTYMNPGDGFAPDGGGHFYEGGPYDDGCYDDCNSCWNCPGPIYARGEYLLWWLKGDSAPPLVTTSTQGTARADAGVLGKPNTSILWGDQRFNQDARSGGRVVLGWWADPCCRVEGDFFILGQASESFNQTSTGDPILARPFFNLRTSLQDSVVVAYPNQVTGTISGSETSNFLGAGIRATYNLTCKQTCNYFCRIDAVVGYRYLRLRENLVIDSTAMNLASTAVQPTLAVHDSFSTANNFNGADLGMMAEVCHNRWYGTAIGRLGIGGNWENVAISGQTTSTLNGQSTTTNGGLLALPTNIGNYNKVPFAVVPSLELKLGYDVTDCFRLMIGYDVIYWSRVVRPAQQIDTWVNTSQASGGTLTGTPGPLFAFKETDLWIQGISLGGEFRY